MTDRLGTIVLVNTETERLFGYRRDQLIGQPVEILLPDRLREGHARHRARFAENPAVRRVEASLNLFGLRRDGSEFPVEIGLNPIHTEEGLWVLSVILDVSTRDRMDRLKDEFVSTVSHELRTPLTSIAGSLGLLIGGVAGNLPEPAVRLLTIAQTNSQRLVRLINDILDIEKIESGQSVFNFKTLDACVLVEQVIEANRAYADGFGVRLRLAPGATVCNVRADPDRLAQVITNLLSNGIKFSPPGGEVAVAIEQSADVVHISVRDHGQGIPSEFRPHVFEKFAQADATDARQKGGTGLGLSIVKEIVTRLGGEVRFDDATGGGTVFHVDLPGLIHLPDPEIDGEPGPTAGRLLLCEHDPAAAMVWRESLRPFGFSTDFAHTIAAAIARARVISYDVILVGRIGNEIGRFVRQLREQPQISKTPLVIMSADPHERELQHLKVSCCNGWSNRLMPGGWRRSSRMRLRMARRVVHAFSMSTTILICWIWWRAP